MVEDISLKFFEKHPNNKFLLSFYGEALINLNKGKEGRKIIQKLHKELEKNLEDPDNLYLYGRNIDAFDVFGFGKSFPYHYKASKQGHMYSLNGLGFNYQMGRGTKKNEKSFQMLSNCCR